MIGCYRLNNGVWERFDVISKAMSVIWTKRFYSVGSVQISCRSSSLNAYDIITHEGKSGIIMRPHKKDGEYVAYGYDLKGIASFRKMTEETIAEGTSVEKTLRGWVTTYLLTGDRAIEGLSLASQVGFDYTFEEEITITEGTTLSDALETYCTKFEIGWDITFDKGALTFSFISPRENKDVVFSRKNRTLENPEHIIDAYDEVNNSGTGIFRREGEVNEPAKDYVTGTATPKAVGYLLGDKVSVQEFGITGELQITEIQYVYEPNNIITVPSFGEVKQNIIKRLLKR